MGSGVVNFEDFVISKFFKNCFDIITLRLVSFKNFLNSSNILFFLILEFCLIHLEIFYLIIDHQLGFVLSVNFE